MRIATKPLLRRLVTLDQLIRSGMYPNANSAARCLEVSPRTIHRDLDFLRDTWKAPLEFSPKHNGYYYTDPDYALPTLRLTEGELLALFLSERLVNSLHRVPFGAELAAIVQKLALRLPDEISIDLNHLSAAFSIKPAASSSLDEEQFRRLAHAVRAGRQFRLTYWTASRDETLQRVVDPYHLASIDGEWYLIGYCHLRQEVRSFAVGRIRGLKETGVNCQRPAEFEINEYLDTAFRAFRGQGKPQGVRLHFFEPAARYVRERTWHPSQHIDEQPDGSLILTLSLSHLLEVKRWVLSWGSGCRVLEPEELRSEVAAEVMALRAAYRQGVT